MSAARNEIVKTISYRHFNVLVIVLAAAAVALLPMWPYSRWGLTRSVSLAVIVGFMLMVKRLARSEL